MSRSVSNPLRWRACLALIAIFASLLVTTIAIAPLHGHAQARNCEFCQTAHMPYLPAVGSAVTWNSAPVAWRRNIDPPPIVVSFVRVPWDSRAPPSWS